MSHHEAITRYFNMWVSRDFRELEEVFAADVYYSECNGPEFRGLEQVRKWIAHMLPRQVVTEWRIDRCIDGQDGQVTTVLWSFRAREAEEYHFNGVSIVEYDDRGRIASIREFKSKAEKHTPEFAR